MAKFRDVRTNFSSGLLSRGMQSRLDLAAYNNGCQVLKNWWPLITGGMRRRPGSLFLNELIFDDSFGLMFRAEPFVFNETQRYVIVFTRRELTIFNPDNGNLIQRISLDTDGDILPWFSSPIIQQISVAQLGDTMFITHTSFHNGMQKLKRLSATTFQLEKFEWEKSPTDNTYPWFVPFQNFSAPDVTLAASGITGNVTFTSSADVFDSNYVGRLMHYRDKQFVVTQFNSATEIVGSVKQELPKGSRLTGAGNSSENALDFIVGEIIVGRDTGVKGEVIKVVDNLNIEVAAIAGTYGSATVGEQVEGLDSGNLLTVSIRTPIPPPASANWGEIAFNNSRGWPGVITFHSQRLWLGGSSSLPAHIFGSKVAAFFNFHVGDGFPDESIQALIADEQVSTIVDIVSADHLLVFTDAAEFYAPQSEDQPLTPETFDLLSQTRFGIKTGTRAKRLDEGTIFIQSNGSAVREFIWSDRTRSYTSEAISLLSEQSIDEVQEVTVLYGGYERPEHIAFFRNKTRDGFVSWYHTSRAEQIRAWGIWETQHTPTIDPAVDLSNVMPGEEQSSQNSGVYSIMAMQDKLYAIVVRNMWDVAAGKFRNRAFLERFELSATLDCASFIGGNSANLSVWPDLHPALGSTEVEATAHYWFNHSSKNDPDYFLGTYLLDFEGTLTLDEPSYNVQVGLGYVQELEPMPPEIQLSDGFTVGQPKRIVSADVFVNSTLNLRIGDQKILIFKANEQFFEPNPSFPSQIIPSEPMRLDEVYKFYQLGYSVRPTITVENRIPLACEISGICMEVEY